MLCLVCVFSSVCFVLAIGAVYWLVVHAVDMYSAVFHTVVCVPRFIVFWFFLYL